MPPCVRSPFRDVTLVWFQSVRTLPSDFCVPPGRPVAPRLAGPRLVSDKGHRPASADRAAVSVLSPCWHSSARELGTRFHFKGLGVSSSPVPLCQTHAGVPMELVTASLISRFGLRVLLALGKPPSRWSAPRRRDPPLPVL